MNDKFIMSQEDWDTIIVYSKMSYDKWKTEIGGMLVAVFDKKNNKMIIKDPVIGKQEVSGVNCTLDKEWLADYYVEMAVKHGINVRFVWWHSHHNMGVQWSGTDTATMGEFSDGDYSMSLVVNLAEDHTFRVNWWKPTSGYIDTKIKILKPQFEISSEMQVNFDKLISREAKAIVRTVVKNDNYSNYANSYWQKYKQPGNYGPGVVDAELMDRSPSLQGKYCDTMEKLLDNAFTEQMKWPDFDRKWSIIIEDAGKHDIIIESFSKSEYIDLMTGEFPDATDYFESPEQSLFLTRPTNFTRYGDPLQENLF